MTSKWDNLIKCLAQGSVHVAPLLESIRFKSVGDIKDMPRVTSLFLFIVLIAPAEVSGRKEMGTVLQSWQTATAADRQSGLPCLPPCWHLALHTWVKLLFYSLGHRGWGVGGARKMIHQLGRDQSPRSNRKGFKSACTWTHLHSVCKVTARQAHY